MLDADHRPTPSDRRTILARLEPGPFTLTEAFAAGLTRAVVRQRVKTGRWTVLRRGVLCETSLTARVDPVWLSARAAVLAMGQGAAASHETAAHLHHLPTVRSRTSSVWLTRPPTSGHGRHSQPGIIERAAALPPWQVVSLGGLRATSVARTVVDLGRHLPFREAVVVADAALRQGIATPEELLAVRDSCAWWPGIDSAAKVLGFADGRAEGALESVSRVMLAELGFPPAILQATIQTRDGTYYRADFLWKAQRVIGEADGRLKYETREDVWREKLREDRLRDAGFEIVRWVWDEAMYRQEQVAERIRRAAERQSRPF